MCINDNQIGKMKKKPWMTTWNWSPSSSSLVLDNIKWMWRKKHYYLLLVNKNQWLVCQMIIWTRWKNENSGQQQQQQEREKKQMANHYDHLCNFFSKNFFSLNKLKIHVSIFFFTEKKWKYFFTNTTLADHFHFFFFFTS